MFVNVRLQLRWSLSGGGGMWSCSCGNRGSVAALRMVAVRFGHGVSGHHSSAVEIRTDAPVGRQPATDWTAKSNHLVDDATIEFDPALLATATALAGKLNLDEPIWVATVSTRPLQTPRPRTVTRPCDPRSRPGRWSSVAPRSQTPSCRGRLPRAGHRALGCPARRLPRT